MIMDINQPFVTQEQKFKYWEESKAEIQTLRTKVVSADVLVEALREIIIHDDSEKYVCEKIARKALTTYDKLSEVKHDTK